ncbi:hypothetical protein [Clostridioides difficile]|uniref:hypothetical protein n=1 Tax=Clostridioides difficile TaxID=1496 RepID=UPI0012DE3912|nr:hypothetical protein [Clostridioides difficile]MDV9476572.1 hypothetical protein [Clostridioides difficile]HBG3469712.1 hypothetical protein [Clostridioides difficile]
MKILNLFWDFILTMWYVKSHQQIQLCHLQSYFILTMWYVKVFDNLKSSFAELDFILTMWKKINKKRKHLLLVGAFVLLKLVG